MGWLAGQVTGHRPVWEWVMGEWCVEIKAGLGFHTLGHSVEGQGLQAFPLHMPVARVDGGIIFPLQPLVCSGSHSLPAHSPSTLLSLEEWRRDLTNSTELPASAPLWQALQFAARHPYTFQKNQLLVACG